MRELARVNLIGVSCAQNRTYKQGRGMISAGQVGSTGTVQHRYTMAYTKGHSIQWEG